MKQLLSVFIFYLISALFSYSIGHIFLYAPSLRAKTPSRPWKAEGRTMQEQLSRSEAKSKHAEQLQNELKRPESFLFFLFFQQSNQRSIV